jgi:hypothetical protein
MKSKIKDGVVLLGAFGINMNIRKNYFLKVLGVFLTVGYLTACSSWLPKAGNESFYFNSFAEAQHAIESLVPMKSNLQDLIALNLDPGHQPNTVILSFADISKKFVGSGVLSKEDLGPGVSACLAARDACRGWDLNISRIDKKRTGAFFQDFINYRRRTETTGWRFNALILMVDDVVLYRSWGGQPEVNEIDNQKNPLGPLQDIGPAIITTH